MHLTILGSGTGALQLHRGPSGYLLKLNDQIFLLDGGTGTLLKCLKAGVSYKEIDKIFYTHLHPDHTIDLIPFLFATKHTPAFKRMKPLDIYGPVGFEKFFYTLTDLFGTGILDVKYDINIKELDETTVLFDSGNFETRFMLHSKNAIGYRFEAEGKVFVYSGDTDYCQEIIELSQNAHVLLLECSFADNMKVSGHLTPTEAGNIAAKAGVEKLILTHFYPTCDDEEILRTCQKKFKGQVIIATDLMQMKI